jgi:hypothetical protein
MDRKDHAISLRPAKPEFEEGLQFAQYLEQAAECFFRTMLDRQSDSIIATAFIEPGHSLSYENVKFVEVDKNNCWYEFSIFWQATTEVF